MKKVKQKKLMSLLLALIMIIMLLPVQSFAYYDWGTVYPMSMKAIPAFGGGSGAEGDPYLISSVADLKDLVDYVYLAGGMHYGTSFSDKYGVYSDCRGKHFLLTSDLDMDDYLSAYGDFYGISFFRGSFDGGGYTISNMTVVKRPYQGNAMKPYFEDHGFFQILGGSIAWTEGGVRHEATAASVRNLNFENANSSGSGKSAIIAGTVTDSLRQGNEDGTIYGDLLNLAPTTYDDIIIENCSVTGSVSGDDKAAGLVAYGDTYSCSLVIRNCSADVKLNMGTYNTTKADGAGGLIGGARHAIVENSHSTTNIEAKYSRSSGGIAGYVSSGSITDCYAFVGINASNNIGGIVGSTGATISNCYSSGEISGTYGLRRYTENGSVEYFVAEYLGGIAGFTAGSILNCYSSVNVTGNRDIGGIVGHSGGSIINTYATGTLKANYCVYWTSIEGDTRISGSIKVGGIAGSVSGKGKLANCVAMNPSITNVYAVNNIYTYRDTPNPVNINRAVGDLQISDVSAVYAWSGMKIQLIKTTVNAITNDTPVYADPVDDTTVSSAAGADGLSKTTAELRAEDISTYFENTEDNFTDNWVYTAQNSEYPKVPVIKTIQSKVQSDNLPYYILDPDTNSNPEGSLQNPYKIYSIADMSTLALQVNSGRDSYSGKYFVLCSDLDLSVYTNWNSIGRDGKAFKGSFDGGQHTIKNVNINSSGDYMGLFGVVDGGTIKNIELSGYSITAGSKSGGLIGWLKSGSVSHCFASGAITTSGAGAAGGLVGKANSGTNIEKCFTKGEVMVKSTGSAAQNSGGLVGDNSGTISNSYSLAVVRSGNSASYVGINAGGLTGINSGTISGCFSMGPVSAGDAAGGLVGQNNGSIINSVCISAAATNLLAENTVNYGRITGINSGTISGGYAFRGLLVAGSIVSCSDAADKNGADITATQIQNQSNWDTWLGTSSIFTGASENYLPVLDGFNIAQSNYIPYYITDVLNIGQTEDNPYIMNTYFDMTVLSYLVNGGVDYAGIFFKLARNLDFYENGDKTIWHPIGDENNAFIGYFDGNGKIIDHIYTRGWLTYQGLFGHISNKGSISGYVKNITLTNFKMMAGSYSGALVGKYDSTAALIGITVGESQITSKIIGRGSRIGTLAGYFNGQLSNYHNTVPIRGGDGIFGCVGPEGVVTACTNDSTNVSGSGIAGENLGTIVNSGTSVYVSGNAVVGSNSGLIKDYTNEVIVKGAGIAGSNSGTIINCENKAAVYGSGIAGGSAGTIDSCTNSGAVGGAGIVGNNSGTVTGCVNDGVLTDSSGITDKNSNLITNCTNNGAISGTNVGGIAGTNTGTISFSINNGIISGGDKIGGITGISSGNIIDSKNNGTVTGNEHVGGIAGRIYVYSRADRESVTTNYDPNNAYTIYHEPPAKTVEISGCTNADTAVITGSCLVGGITGSVVAGRERSEYEYYRVYANTTLNINSCSNKAKVISSNGNTGGIIGFLLAGGTGATTFLNYIPNQADKNIDIPVYNNTVNVSSCYNCGSVTVTGAHDRVGGIVGNVEAYGDKPSLSFYETNGFDQVKENTISDVSITQGNNYANIYECYNTGSVSSQANYVGGIAGIVYSSSGERLNNDGVTVSDVYSTGSVTGNNYVGGLVGSFGSNRTGMNGQFTATLSNGYSTGQVTAANYAGGIAGSIVGSTGTSGNCVVNTSNLLAMNDGIIKKSGTNYTSFGRVAGEVLNAALSNAHSWYGVGNNRYVVEDTDTSVAQNKKHGLSIATDIIKQAATMTASITDGSEQQTAIWTFADNKLQLLLSDSSLTEQSDNWPGHEGEATVTFKSGNITSSDFYSATFAKGTVIDKLFPTEKPTKEGVQFVSWSSLENDSPLSTEHTFTKTSYTYSDINIYPVWTLPAPYIPLKADAQSNNTIYTIKTNNETYVNNINKIYIDGSEYSKANSESALNNVNNGYFYLSSSDIKLSYKALSTTGKHKIEIVAKTLTYEKYTGTYVVVPSGTVKPIVTLVSPSSSSDFSSKDAISATLNASAIGGNTVTEWWFKKSDSEAEAAFTDGTGWTKGSELLSDTVTIDSGNGVYIHWYVTDDANLSDQGKVGPFYIDKTAPTVVGVSPTGSDIATNALTNSYISVTFSEEMKGVKLPSYYNMYNYGTITLNDGSNTYTLQRNDYSSSLGYTGTLQQDGTYTIKYSIPSSLTLARGKTYTYSFSGFTDVLGNALTTPSPAKSFTTADGGTVSTPAASLDSGAYTGAQYVSIDCDTSGANIYYTLDGSVPNPSTLYVGATRQFNKGNPILITASCTLTFFASKQDYDNSAVITKTYTLTGEKASIPTADLASGTYTGVRTVQLSCDTPGSDIYYTLPGYNGYLKYEGPILLMPYTTYQQVGSSYQQVTITELTVRAYSVAPGYMMSEYSPDYSYKINMPSPSADTTTRCPINKSAIRVFG